MLIEFPMMIAPQNYLDSNRNVWSEEFEPGSIQRTNTLILSIEKVIFPTLQEHSLY